jgi:GGDEF domain-containing protein
MVVVTEQPATDVVKALAAAGAFPVVEARWADAPAAFNAIKPTAIVVAQPGPAADADAAHALEEQLNNGPGPFIPLIGRARENMPAALADGLAIDADASANRLVARLRSALRVRALHATVLRRAESLASQTGRSVDFPEGDPLEDATILVAGRGGSYLDLANAVGERSGLITALSIETAANYLNARQIDGIILADGFGGPLVESFLMALAEDPHFREMPIAMLNKSVGVGPFYPVLANLERLPNEPEKVLRWMLPLARLRAFEARLARMLKTLDAEGMFDADTGLLSDEMFIDKLLRVVEQASYQGKPLCVARFAFDVHLDVRISLDAARLLGTAIRDVDFACRDTDGAVLVVFTETELQAAHVRARRIATTLKETMQVGGRDPRHAAAAITLATLRPNDTAETLLRRAGSRAVAAVPIPA